MKKYITIIGPDCSIGVISAGEMQLFLSTLATVIIFFAALVPILFEFLDKYRSRRLVALGSEVVFKYNKAKEQHQRLLSKAMELTEPEKSTAVSRIDSQIEVGYQYLHIDPISIQRLNSSCVQGDLNGIEKNLRRILGDIEKSSVTDNPENGFEKHLSIYIQKYKKYSNSVRGIKYILYGWVALLFAALLGTLYPDLLVTGPTISYLTSSFFLVALGVLTLKTISYFYKLIDLDIRQKERSE